jgi:hypothetical protein
MWEMHTGMYLKKKRVKPMPKKHFPFLYFLSSKAYTHKSKDDEQIYGLNKG